TKERLKGVVKPVGAGTMKKKRLLVRLLLLIVVAIAGFLLIAWWTAPTNITTVERFAMIRGDETVDQLEEILGAPGEDKPGYPWFPEGDAPAGTAELRFAPREFRLLSIAPGWIEWQTRDGQRIGVCFDESGRVVVAARYVERESWFEQTRRW